MCRITKKISNEILQGKQTIIFLDDVFFFQDTASELENIG